MNEYPIIENRTNFFFNYDVKYILKFFLNNKTFNSLRKVAPTGVNPYLPAVLSS